MTVQELKSIRFIRKRIVELEGAIETLRSEMERTTPSLSQAPCKGSECDKRAGQIARMVELKTERIEQYTALEAAVDRAETWLTTLPEQQAKVIRARHIEGMSWRMVAKETGYRKTHCEKIHDSAIKKIS